MRGQTLVPLAGPLLRDRLHEVPLQLADAGVMPEQVLLRLIELLCGGKTRAGSRQCGGGEASGSGKQSGEGKIRSGGESRMGREREDGGYVRSWERITNREKMSDYVSFCCFNLLQIKSSRSRVNWSF